MPNHEINRLSSAVHQRQFPLAVRLASRTPVDSDEAWRLFELQTRSAELSRRANIFVEDFKRLCLTDEDNERLVSKVFGATHSGELDERTEFMNYLTAASAALGEMANQLSVIFPDTYQQPPLKDSSPLTPTAGKI